MNEIFLSVGNIIRTQIHYISRIKYTLQKKGFIGRGNFPRHSHIFNYTEFDAIRQRSLLQTHQNRIPFRKEQFQSNLFFLLRIEKRYW